jgi:hypothetical protein
LPQLQVAVISSYFGCVSAFIVLNLTLRAPNDTRDNSNIKHQSGEQKNSEHSVERNRCKSSIITCKKA